MPSSTIPDTGVLFLKLRPTAHDDARFRRALREAAARCDARRDPPMPSVPRPPAAEPPSAS